MIKRNSTIAKEKLLQGLRAKFPQIDSESLMLFINMCEYRVYKNRQVIIEKGSAERIFGFVVSGIIRGYKIDAKGEETNLFLVPEGSSIGSPDHLYEGLATQYRFESILESEVLVYDASSIEKLCEEHPKMYRFLLAGVKITIQTLTARIESMIELSPEQRYEDLLKKHPVFFQKALNKHIANYLGITPVSLSRIIKRQRDRMVS
jgi:CRP-like cAMP-binding protein